MLRYVYKIPCYFWWCAASLFFLRWYTNITLFHWALYACISLWYYFFIGLLPFSKASLYVYFSLILLLYWLIAFFAILSYWLTMVIYSSGWFVLGNKIGLKYGIIGQKCGFIHLFLGSFAILIIYYWFIWLLKMI